MSELEEEEVSSSRRPKDRGGIKNFNFYGGIRTNGVSHRKNATKKKQKYLKNKAQRSSLYSRRGSMGAAEWHVSLDNLSKGLA